MPRGRILGLMAVGFWLVMMAMLIHRQNYTPFTSSFSEIVTPATLPENQRAGHQEEWMGVYYQGEKIGWHHVSSNPRAGGFLIREESLMHLKIMGTPQMIWTETSCLTDEVFALISFTYHMKSGVASLSVSGEVKEKTIRLEINSAGKTQEKIIPVTSPPYLFLNLRSCLASTGFEVGKSYRFPVVLPSSLSHSEALFVVEAEEEITIHEQVWKAFRVKASYAGLETTGWYDREEGRVLKEVSPMGLTMVREDAHKAVQGVTSTEGVVDIAVSTRIPVDSTLPDPAALRYLRVSLEGIPSVSFDLQGGRQSLEGLVLEVAREDLETLSSVTVPIEGEEFQAFLAPTLFVQSDDERIQRLAKEIVGQEQDGLRAAGRLMDWVYRNLDKRPTVSLPNALEVLDLGAGDCNEHAVLMTALSRAVGLPAKVVVGVVFSEDGFYYHAWNEVWVGQWVSVDPVMSQLPADVTHLRFIAGGLGEQIRMAQIVGRVSLDIQEYR